MTDPAPDPPSGPDSASWRAPPPHMPISAASTQYVSARTQSGEDPTAPPGARTQSPAPSGLRGTPYHRTPSQISPGSPRPGTTSPSVPLISARVMADGHGGYYLVHTETGMRIEVIDDESILLPDDTLHPSNINPPPSDASPSDTSDLSGSPASTAAQDGGTTDSKVAALIEELGPDSLTAPQIDTLHQLRGSMATGRDRLFTTTAMLLDHQNDTLETHAALTEFRNEVAARLDDMHNELMGKRDQLNGCVRDNVKVLRDLGVSEALLGQILSDAAKLRAQKLARPELPTTAAPSNADTPPDILAGANAAIAPRRPGESMDDFTKRAEASLARKERSATAFAPAPNTSPQAANRAPLVTRFEDVGSISTAPRRGALPHSTNRRQNTGISSISVTGYMTANDGESGLGDMFEIFRAEVHEEIARIVNHHLADELDLPARIKPPRLDNPPKFTGIDDQQAFIRWIEKLVAWMRTMFYGGPDADSYRVSVLKNLLDGVALEWYIDRRDGDDEPRDFISVLCALHTRFITTATAHHALREFEQIKFRFDDGPLKLLDQLETCSRRMREPLPDIIIRQKFMELIPAELHDKLTELRGISAAYSSIAQMRTQSSQLWTARSGLRGAGRPQARPPPAPTPAANPARRPTPASDARPHTQIPGHSSPHSSNLGHPPNRPGAAPARPTVRTNGPNSDKTCFRCGIVGHIGSDPICALNADLTPKERPRVGAQRVLDSYAADDDELGLEYADEDIHDDWGGAQYDGPEDPPAESKGDDLGELLDTVESEDARLGTIRFQYYSMRIPDGAPTAADLDDPGVIAAIALMDALPRNLRFRQGWSASASGDVALINIHRVTNGLPELTLREQSVLRSNLRRAHYYPADPAVHFPHLALEFEERFGVNTSTRLASNQWDALLQLNAAEHLHEASRSALAVDISATEEPSSRELALTSVEDLAALLIAYDTREADLEILHNEIAALNRLARETRLQILDQLATPRGAELHARRALDSALDLVDDTMHSTARVLSVIQNRFDTGAAYRVRLRYEHSLRPSLRDSLEGPVALPPAHEGVIPVLVISDDESVSDDFEDAHSDETPPPSVGSTPPPSYPGTPESSGAVSPIDIESEDELWADNPTPAPELLATPAPAPPSTANTGESDEELWGTFPTPEEELMTLPSDPTSVRAMRIDATPENPFQAGGYTPNESTARLERGVDQTHQRAARREAELAEFPYSTDHPRPRDNDDYRRASDWENVPGLREFEGNPDDPRDERMLWIYGSNFDFGRRSVPDEIFSLELGDQGVDTATDEDPHSIAQCGEEFLESSELPASDDTQLTLEPHPDDPCIMKTLVSLTGTDTELYLSCTDRHGNVYVKVQPLPTAPLLNPGLQGEHERALKRAIEGRATELGLDTQMDHAPVTWPVNSDLSPSHDEENIEEDGAGADPERHVQVFVQHVEHLSNINRREVNELEQPSRLRKEIACLSAQVEIAGTLAYILFDSGSNIDSLTPEFARATKCKPIKLDDQVTLQLGCVGSRSKISYGTRPAVNFGGIRGHVYFDQANLDRYDGIIGTPFMNKHGIVLDFGKREIRFPNNRVIKALTTLEEASLLATRTTEESRRPSGH